MTTPVSGSMMDPAKRLLRILDAIPRSADQTALASWAQVFGLAPDDWAAVAKRATHVISLAKLVPRLVIDVEGAEEGNETLTSYDEINQVMTNFQVMTQVPSNQAMAPYTGAGRNCLRAASKVLQHSASHWDFAPEAIEELRQDGLDLRTTVLMSNLSPETKAWLVAAVDEFLEAVDLAWIDGPEVVQRATDTIIGGLVQRDPEQQSVAPEVRDKVFKLLNTVRVTANAAILVYNGIAGFKGWTILPTVPNIADFRMQIGATPSPDTPKSLPPGPTPIEPGRDE